MTTSLEQYHRHPAQPLIDDACSPIPEAAIGLSDWDRGGFDAFNSLDNDRNLVLSDGTHMAVETVDFEAGKIELQGQGVTVTIDRGRGLVRNEMTFSVSGNDAFEVEVKVTLTKDGDDYDVGMAQSYRVAAQGFLDLKSGAEVFRKTVDAISKIALKDERH